MSGPLFIEGSRRGSPAGRVRPKHAGAKLRDKAAARPIHQPRPLCRARGRVTDWATLSRIRFERVSIGSPTRRVVWVRPGPDTPARPGRTAVRAPLCWPEQTTGATPTRRVGFPLDESRSKRPPPRRSPGSRCLPRAPACRVPASGNRAQPADWPSNPRLFGC